MARPKLTTETIEDRLKERNIKLLDNYVDNKTNIRWQCLIDGHIWKINPDNVFHGTGCPKCAIGALFLTNEEIDTRLNGRNIKRVEDYERSSKKIKYQCLIDGHIWMSTTNNILKGQGCPKCSIGKSEKRILALIETYCSFDYLKTHKILRFNNKYYFPDFYLETGSTTILIEYNGEQHYKPTRFGHMTKEETEKNFINQQKRDEEIRKYCKKNNIGLLEIPYYWKEDKIIEELQKLFL